ncbi:MAG: NAD(P)-dependent oxidoreductase [Rhodospirillales bacterium]|nr:NAD(P)-dependent oxidoreductase [Rhodospirillales bacterium]
MSEVTQRIGFIGLGNMGTPMVRRLLAAGHDVVIWNRSAERLAPLVAEGATAAGSPLAVAQAADLVGLCLTDHRAVEAVVAGPQGLAAIGAAGAGKVFVDFSTIGPEVTVRLAGALREATGAGWVDAPVSGGVPGAETGTLIVFAGGDPADIARAQPLFACVASRVTAMGPSGAGQTTKICNQMIVAVNVLTIAETFAFARRAGVAVENLTAALAGGFADSKPLQIFGPRMASRRFTPRQSGIELMGKDLGLSQALAGKLGAATPVAALCAALYQTIRQRADIDYSADVSELVRVYEADPPKT